MPVVFEIDTKKTLYEPREIKIDGEIFKVQPITLRNLETVQTLWQEARDGSAVAIRKMLGSIFDERAVEILINLEINQLYQVITAAVSKAANPEAIEKNEPRPAEDKLPS